MRVLALLVVALIAGFGPSAAPAMAADVPPRSLGSAAPSFSPAAFDARFQGEVRAGVFAHDPDSPEGGSADVNVEVLFGKLPIAVEPAWAFLVPRPHVGATLNLSGATSMIYGGVTWTFDLTPQVFVEGGFGGVVHNGETGIGDPNRSPLGCSVLFHEQGTLGFRLTPQWSVMATIEHASNAGLCAFNRGLTNYGVRLGYRF